MATDDQNPFSGDRAVPQPEHVEGQGGTEQPAQSSQGTGEVVAS